MAMLIHNLRLFGKRPYKLNLGYYLLHLGA